MMSPAQQHPPDATPQDGAADAAISPHYKWLALSNTTIAVLLATIDASIMLIAMPEIFRGIQLNPLDPGNSFYLLWMILGFLIVSSVLVVSLGRLGDLYGACACTTSASPCSRWPRWRWRSIRSPAASAPTG